MRIVKCMTVLSFSGECCEFRQVYSSILSMITTSHDQFICFIRIKLECTLTKLNGSQFRQVYSSFSLQSNHSQIRHENSRRMPHHQTEVISNWASLFIIPIFSKHSSIPRKQHGNSDSLHSILAFQLLPNCPHSQSHIFDK